MILRIIAYPPKGWPVWLWRFSGAFGCDIKVDTEVYSFKWAQEFTINVSGDRHHLKIFHNAGTLPAKATHIDVKGNEVLVRFRARFLPWRPGRVEVDESPSGKESTFGAA